MSGEMPAEPNNDARTSAEELRAALASHGIEFPLLRPEPITDTPGFPCPLLSLGDCNLDTARKLTAVLQASQGAKTDG